MLVLVLVFRCELCLVQPGTGSFGKPHTCSVHVLHVHCSVFKVAVFVSVSVNFHICTFIFCELCTAVRHAAR